MRNNYTTGKVKVKSQITNLQSLRFFVLTLTICILPFELNTLSAQSYRCDWSVSGIAGGDMTGAYRCGSTVGQTAVGLLSGDNLLAHIGFWVPEIFVGIQERERFRLDAVTIKETRLYPAMPNPFTRTTQIRYTLSTERSTLVEICDISGRVVRTLLNSRQKPGRYSLNWDAKDNAGRTVACGVYFVRFKADDYQRNLKIVLNR